LARALVEHLGRKSLEARPASQAEIEHARQLRWEDIDRPRSVKTGYAYLPFAELSSGDAEFALMERAVEAVADLSEPKEFVPTIEAKLGEGHGLNFGMAPLLTPDGRVVTEGLDLPIQPIPPQPYAKAAASLEEVGQTTGLVATSPGLFVEVAVQILPAYRAEPSEAELIVRRAVEAERIRPELDRIKQAARSAGSITLSPKQQTLTRLVWREE
jgi:hypothetical protein